MSTDQAIEQQIQAVGANVAPRITPDDIAANIASEHYFTAADGVFGDIFRVEHDVNEDEFVDKVDQIPAHLLLLTFCVLVLKNGFTVTGESACASPENFNAEIGRRIARENAVAKIWPLMGYELRTRIADGQPLVAKARTPYTNYDVVSWESLPYQDARLYRFCDGLTEQVTGEEVRDALKAGTEAIGGDIGTALAVRKHNEATGGKSA